MNAIKYYKFKVFFNLTLLNNYLIFNQIIISINFIILYYVQQCFTGFYSIPIRKI
jgi:hypothetical protein